ncbi:MAG TPA: hypothetical protein VF304_14925 [Casimicrobiaceae bacterium]
MANRRNVEKLRAPTSFLTVAALVVSATAFAALLPHRLYGRHIAGQVVDAATQQPVPGAHVAYLWRSTVNPSGFTGHNARDICFHAAATVADAQGRFDVPAWSKWKTYDVDAVDPTVLIYAPGFEPIQKHLHSAASHEPVDHLQERYALNVFSGTVDQRLDMLFYGLANQDCDWGGESKKSLVPMLKAIYLEVRPLQGSERYSHIAKSVAYFAADAGLAMSPNTPIDDTKINAFIAEHIQ